MARAVPAWVTTPIQAVFRTRIKELADGSVCASWEAAVKLSKIVTYLVIAFLIWWVVQEPTNAAHLVHNIGTFLSDAAHGMSNFVASI
jgi:ABC-type glucose/galactose transport system permease subunit